MDLAIISCEPIHVSNSTSYDSVIHDLQDLNYWINLAEETSNMPPLNVDALDNLVPYTPSSTDTESMSGDSDHDETRSRKDSFEKSMKHLSVGDMFASKPCQVPGCTQRARRGKFCPHHGGTKCCRIPSCGNAVQSHGLCKAHGGGARCTVSGCDKSSQGGGLCRAHGGGKRCSHEGCNKGVQRGNKCATHAGFRVCRVQGCPRPDRGAGLCERHHRENQCSVAHCKRLSHALGLCKLHLRQQNRHF
ncbi:hypothetical protein AC1031_003500 [Aphanomyces cochlioides]|nr:hypothetical protein AC1031_003500 [Aphanomyces cochlioides]